MWNIAHTQHTTIFSSFCHFSLLAAQIYLLFCDLRGPSLFLFSSFHYIFFSFFFVDFIRFLSLWRSVGVYSLTHTISFTKKKWVTFTIISGPSEYAMYCTYSFLCFRKKGAAFSREIECKRGSKWECESVCVCARGKKSYYRKSTINNAISQWAANHYYFGFLYPIIVCYEP